MSTDIYELYLLLQKHLDPDSRPPSIHQCEKCDYKTGWPSNLKRHLRTVHGENQERVYECPSCATIQVKLLYNSIPRKRYFVNGPHNGIPTTAKRHGLFVSLTVNLVLLSFLFKVSKDDVVVCKACRKTFNSSEMIKQHVQNITQQQMNAEEANTTVQKITKTVLNTENKRLGDGGKSCMLPTDLVAGTQRNQNIETLYVNSEQKGVKTFYGLGKDNAVVISKASENMHAVSAKVKIIQESPVIDKNLDTYEHATMHNRIGSPSNSDVNGNSDLEVSADIDKTSVIETNMVEGLPSTRKRSQLLQMVNSSSR